MSHTHRDYEPFEMAENMEEDLGMFEAAMRSGPVELDSTAVGKVLCLAGNSQLQSTVSELAQAVCRRVGTQVVQGNTEEFLAGVPANLGDIGLIVAPSPLVMESPGAKGLGQGVDALLMDSPVPILFVREAMTAGAIENALDTVMVAISRHDAGAEQALSWVFRLAANQVILLEWVDRHAIDEAKRLLGDREENQSVQQAMIGRAVSSELGSLVAVSQRHAKDKGIAVHVEFRMGNPLAETLDASHAFACGMIVLARSKDHTSAAYHLASDLLMATDTPVLVI